MPGTSCRHAVDMTVDMTVDVTMTSFFLWTNVSNIKFYHSGTTLELETVLAILIQFKFQIFK